MLVGQLTGLIVTFYNRQKIKIGLLDKIGEVLWFAMFFMPLVTVPIVWRRSKQLKIYRVLIGLAIAFVISFVFFVISWIRTNLIKGAAANRVGASPLVSDEVHLSHRRTYGSRIRRFGMS